MIYFGAPSLDTMISPLPQMISSHNPILYKPFTWCEFKKAAYSLRLAGRRLDLFKYNYNKKFNNFNFVGPQDEAGLDKMCRVSEFVQRGWFEGGFMTRRLVYVYLD